MKRFLILLFLVPFALLGQNLKDKINTDIRGKIYDPAKAANMHQAIVDGMIAVTASGTNAYTATVNAAITSYQTGYQQAVKFTNANTTASTINFNALGVKSLVKDGAGTALASGDLKANTTYLLSYDGTNFQVLNIAGSGGGGGISGLTSGRVTFATSATTIGDSPNLLFNSGTNLLTLAGVSGTSTATTLLKIPTFQSGTTPNGISTVGDYNLSVDQSFLNSDGQRNAVMNLGYNVSSNGTRQNTNEASVRFAIESHYIGSGTSPTGDIEVHLESTDRAGDVRRHFTSNIQKANGTSSQAWRTNTVQWSDETATYLSSYLGSLSLSSASRSLNISLDPNGVYFTPVGSFTNGVDFSGFNIMSVPNGVFKNSNLLVGTFGTPAERVHAYAGAGTNTYMLSENISASQVAGFRAKNDATNFVEMSMYGSSVATVGALTANNAFVQTSSPRLVLASGNASGEIVFATGSGVPQQAVIASNGFMGIGTPTPNYNLHIKGSSNTNAYVESTGTTNSSNYIANNNANQTFQLGRLGTGYATYGVLNAGRGYLYSSTGSIAIGADNSNGEIIFGTGSSVPERMRLNASGQLGIGTTSPATSALLDLTSSTRALKLTEATRASITTPVNGMLTVDTNVPYFHNGTSWINLLSKKASNWVDDLSSTPTAAGTTTLTVSSNKIQLFTGATTQTMVLPDATTLTVGHTFIVHNQSSGVVTVQTNGGATIRLIAGGFDAEFVCTSIGTAAGTWEIQSNVNSATGKGLTVNHSLTLAGTDGTTMTFPSTSATIARTDAANTFTGIQSMTSPAITTSITTPSTSFDAFNTTATTGNLFGAATTVTIGATTGTLNLRNVTLAAANATSFAMNGVSPSITTTSTGTASVFNTAALTGNLFGAATTVTIGGTPTTALTANIFTNATATATIKTINIGTGGASGSSTNVNIGSAVTGASSGTLTLGMTTIAQSANFTSINLLTTQTTTIDAFGAATNLSIGNTATAAQTVNMFTASTGASTYNIATGATLTATTKTINIGTAGVSGSTTNVSIGSATGGGQINLNERVIFQSTETAGGTTGNQTINLPSGSVNFAAAATSITVTNSLATTTSHIFCTIETNDATATIKNVVRASGSFTINLNAAATAETRVGFLVIN